MLPRPVTAVAAVERVVFPRRQERSKKNRTVNVSAPGKKFLTLHRLALSDKHYVSLTRIDRRSSRQRTGERGAPRAVTTRNFAQVPHDEADSRSRSAQGSARGFLVPRQTMPMPTGQIPVRPVPTCSAALRPEAPHSPPRDR